MEQNDKVLVVDGTNSFIINYTANNSITNMGIPVGGIVGGLSSLRNCIRKFKPSKVIVVFDGAGGSSKRKAMFSQYKANRVTSKSAIYSKFLTQFPMDFCQRNMRQQKQKLIEYLELLPVSILIYDGVQGDDVIAFVANHFYRKHNSKVIINSTDRDFLQLINERINVYSPVKKKIYNIQAVIDEFNVHPNNFILYKTILGDKSDNVNGIYGIGKKTFLKLFPFLIEQRQISLSEFIDIAKNIDSKAKVIQTLNQNTDILYRNYDLMQLNESIISASKQYQLERILQSLQITKTNKAQFRRKFYFDGLTIGISDVGNMLDEFDYINSMVIKRNKKITQ